MSDKTPAAPADAINPTPEAPTPAETPPTVQLSVFTAGLIAGPVMV